MPLRPTTKGHLPTALQWVARRAQHLARSARPTTTGDLKRAGYRE